MLADQLNELIIEITILRESIVTAAEWDNQARQDRQKLLDTTLMSVQGWLRILVGAQVGLIVLVIWLFLRG
jgi:hypothetical protein